MMNNGQCLNYDKLWENTHLALEMVGGKARFHYLQAFGLIGLSGLIEVIKDLYVLHTQICQSVWSDWSV